MASEDVRHGRQTSRPEKKTKRGTFSKPPVKVACLTCRHSRVRCDGGEPCGGCVAKGKECFYLPSRRGGPRKKRPKVTSPPTLASLDETTFQMVDTLAVPGAGLRDLDFPADIQSMFENFMGSPNSGTATSGTGSVSAPSIKLQSPPREPTRVRVYGNEHDILNGYYIFIHQYFPIFPPPTAPPGVDRPLEFPCSLSDFSVTEPSLPYVPQSPVSLAIAAVLALVPHPEDATPTDMQSVLPRRSYSHKFARLAFEAVESDSELIESSAIPSEALQNERTVPNRYPIHPHTPVELESILALLILSIYEYTQRGNLVKMRNRAIQAHTMAMNMSLHAQGPEVDVFSEAKRRAWWMTFYCVCQGSIVSTTTSQIIYSDPRFTTPLPNFGSDPQGWTILIQAQRALVVATQFIIELNHTLRARGNMANIQDRMKKQDTWIRAVMAQAKAQVPAQAIGIDDYTSEYNVAQSIRSISMIKLSSARIKTHRFRAFMDIPIFFKKHCDLTCASIECRDEKTPPETDNQGFSRLSCCSNFSNIPSTAAGEGPAYPWIPEDSFPFSGFESTMICLQSALKIAEMFSILPYPNPPYRTDALGVPEPGPVYPRTMPSFACCAMQSSYAMLMLYHKSPQLVQQAENARQPLDLEELADDLYNGISCVLSAVQNYSIAFEALGGMKEEIESAFLRAFPYSA